MLGKWPVVHHLSHPGVHDPEQEAGCNAVFHVVTLSWLTLPCVAMWFLSLV